jgi:hypothetical protein
LTSPPKGADRHIEKLRRDPAVDAFACSLPELNHYFERRALINQQNGTLQTYVGLVDQSRDILKSGAPRIVVQKRLVP